MFKDTQESIALFGGSFDPPHLGHLSIIKESLKMLEIDKLIVVPTFLNPFKKSSNETPYQRLKLSKELFGTISKVFISDYEINQGRATTTIQTLNHFQEQYRVKHIIIGADNLTSIHEWHEFKKLNEQIIWVIATRDSYKLETTFLKRFILLQIDVNISSTKIREQNKNKRISMTLNDRIERIVNELDKKKASEIEVFNLENVDYIAKRVVLTTSLGGKHSSALAQHLKEELKPLGEEFLHIDESEDWVVIDMGDILVHIMNSEARQTYSLEEFLTDIGNRKQEEFLK